MSDCQIESCDGQRGIVLTTRPASQGESLVLQFSTPSGESASFSARVLSSTPETEGGSVRFRVHLVLSPAPTAAPGTSL